MFVITQGKGFGMTFANGWSVSVQWGVLNYCAAQDYGSLDREPERKERFWQSKTAECAVFNPDGVMVLLSPYDTVKGWMTTDEVAALLNAVATGTFVPAEAPQEDAE